MSKWYNTTKQWKLKVLLDRPEWMRNLQENFVLEKLQHWRNTSERRDSCVDQKSTEINQSHQSPFSAGVGAGANCGRPEATTVVTQDDGVLSHFVVPIALCNKKGYYTIIGRNRFETSYFLFIFVYLKFSIYLNVFSLKKITDQYLHIKESLSSLEKCFGNVPFLFLHKVVKLTRLKQVIINNLASLDLPRSKVSDCFSCNNIRRRWTCWASRGRLFPFMLRKHT